MNTSLSLNKLVIIKYFTKFTQTDKITINIFYIPFLVCHYLIRLLLKLKIKLKKKNN